MNTPHLIEIALLMLAAFLIGCLIGYFLRRLAGGETSAPATPESVQKSTTSAPAASSPVATQTEAAPSKVDAGAAKPKPVEKKPAAKKTAPAKTSAAKATSAKPAPVKVAPAKAVAKKPAAKKAAGAPDGKPETLAAPRGGAKDDLKSIKGIGPKIEETLNGMGIYHHDQIAAWGRKEVKWVDEELSFKGRIDREKWISQAKALAKAK